LRIFIRGDACVGVIEHPPDNLQPHYLGRARASLGLGRSLGRLRRFRLFLLLRRILVVVFVAVFLFVGLLVAGFLLAFLFLLVFLLFVFVFLFLFGFVGLFTLAAFSGIVLLAKFHSIANALGHEHYLLSWDREWIDVWEKSNR